MRKNLIRLIAASVAICCSAVASADELVVSAAASLKNAFEEIGQSYEKLNPETTITFNFAASGVLMRQIEQGAPVDLFVSADQATMDKAQAKDLIVNDSRLDFVENKLVLIVPKGQKAPKKLSDLQDKAYVHIAVGTPSSVPAGNYTQQVLNKENLWQTLEPKMVFGESVRQVLQYVAGKEADAGFVYRTDAAIKAKDVDVVLVVPTVTQITYPMARVKASEKTQATQNFMDYLGAAESTEVLEKYGFASPEKKK